MTITIGEFYVRFAGVPYALIGISVASLIFLGMFLEMKLAGMFKKKAK